MKKTKKAFSVLLSATFVLYFWGEMVDFLRKKAGKNLPFYQKNIIKMLHSTKLKKLLYIASFICLLCVCKISLDLIERFLLHVYLTEHPEIQDGHRYLGNATAKKKNCIFIIFDAKHNKNKMALISIGIKIFFRPVSPYRRLNHIADIAVCSGVCDGAAVIL